MINQGLQKEILRYLNNLKTEESLTRNIDRAINFLVGNKILSAEIILRIFH